MYKQTLKESFIAWILVNAIFFYLFFVNAISFKYYFTQPSQLIKGMFFLYLHKTSVLVFSLTFKIMFFF